MVAVEAVVFATGPVVFGTGPGALAFADPLANRSNDATVRVKMSFIWL